MNAATDAAGSDSPKVTEMRVIPVAGHDSMLLNLSGAHGPFFHAQRCYSEKQRGSYRSRRSTRRREHP